MTIISKLQDIGFSHYEAEVYAALLKIGFTTTGPLIKATDLHRMIVYKTLEQLISKSLVQEVLQNNVKHFTTINPEILLEQVEAKKDKVESLIPELKYLRKETRNTLKTRILYGEKGHLENLLTAARAAEKAKDKTIHILGGADMQTVYQDLGEGYATYVKECKKLGVKKQLLYYAKDVSLLKSRFLSEQNTECRITSNSIKNNTFTRVAGNFVSIEIYSSPTVCIQIWSDDVAKGYLDNFQLLWESARKVE